MSKTSLVFFAALMALQASVATAEDFSDPTWPCVQRKVENLSLGIMWPYPVPDSQMRDDIAAQSQQLADTVVLRRVSQEDMQAMIAVFAEDNPDLSADDLGLIFEDAFDKINGDRNRLISGIARYSLSQIELANRIEQARVGMDTEMAKDDPDFDRVDMLEEQLDWDQRIFRDRAQSLLYVCETPVILEKQAFAIAQALSQHVPD